MTVLRRVRVTSASAIAALLAAMACSAPDTAARVDPIGPSRADFRYVLPVLSRRCGSLDCHGSTFRNMRVYGFGGQRLGKSLTPQTPGTLPEELNATYESVIGLEPEIMRDVVLSGGAAPERLTFVRKARGDEDHKGGGPVTRGDPSDRCFLAWLSNRLDAETIAACYAGGCITTSEAGAPQEVVFCP